MCKTREYRKATVELCRNCGGRGYVTEEAVDVNGRLLRQHTTPCPICDGRGRVWKVNAGTVQIEPFDGQTE